MIDKNDTETLDFFTNEDLPEYTFAVFMKDVDKVLYQVLGLIVEDFEPYDWKALYDKDYIPEAAVKRFCKENLGQYYGRWCRS